MRMQKYENTRQKKTIFAASKNRAKKMAKIERTPLKERPFPEYTEKEEKLNSLSHAVGAVLAVGMMAIAVVASLRNPSRLVLFSSLVYTASVLAMFVISSVYHGLPKGMPKQVMRVVDHCNIFLTIAGTYTPIMLIGVLPLNPTMAWSIFAVEWVCALIGIVLNAIDLKKYARFSMCCYLAMGWCVVISLRDTITGLTWPGFAYILAGGIAYTIGAVLYGVGKRKPYRHFVFHIFVVIAAVVQFIGIWKYLL